MTKNEYIEVKNNVKYSYDVAGKDYDTPVQV